MDSSSIAAVISGVAAIVAAGIAGWVTRKGSKESQKRTDQVTAAGLYTALAQDQRTDITNLRQRLDDQGQETRTLRGEVESLRNMVLTLQSALSAMRARARIHMRWDEDLVDQFNSHVPGAHVPPAPPLLEDVD